MFFSSPARHKEEVTGLVNKMTLIGELASHALESSKSEAEGQIQTGSTRSWIPVTPDDRVRKSTTKKHSVSRSDDMAQDSFRTEFLELLEDWDEPKRREKHQVRCSCPHCIVAFFNDLTITRS